MVLAVELLKEAGILCSNISHAFEAYSDDQIKKWNRDEAILGGSLVRVTKLTSGFLDQVCKKKLEIAMILFRCIIDSLITIKYLIIKNTKEAFDEFVEYSFRSEKRLLNLIENNVKERKSELPIESRMKQSIENSFKASGISPDMVDENKRNAWGGSIHNRAKDAGMKDLYLGLFDLPSHDVHGNWQSLIRYNLSHDEEGYLPNNEWGMPRPQPVLTIGLMITDVLDVYLSKRFTQTEDIELLQKTIGDLRERIQTVDRLHEGFLQKTG